MKTLQECKEGVAYIKGFKDWRSLRSAAGDLYLQNRSDEAAEAYAHQFKPKWIPVTERLPKHGERCLFVVDSPEIHRHNSVYGFKNEFSTPGIGFNASLWMLSPEPPKS